MKCFLYFYPMLSGNESKRQLHIHYLLRLLIFWLIIFALYRSVFLVLHISAIRHDGLLLAAQSLVAGIRLDLSTISYLIFPSFLLWVIQQFIRRRKIAAMHSIYNVTIVFLISLLSVSDIWMYDEWGALLNYGVFDYLRNPREVLTFISTSQLLLLAFFFVTYFIFSLWLFKKLVANFSSPTGNKLMKAAMITLPVIILPIMARGGLQLAPINESSAYFSETSFYNHVAVNPFWYFIHSYLDRKITKNPFVFMDETVAEARNKNLYSQTPHSSPTILTVEKPNIVIIILESWTADLIKALGGEKQVTPVFDTLARGGMLFTKIYSAGSRTEHGLISVLSGFPPPPQISIITIPSKAEKLKGINEVLSDYGYNSSFFYGGEIGFANMKSYLVGSHFTTIVDKACFKKNQLNSKWGAHDQYVLEKQLSDLRNTPEPFFSVLLTLSTHEPFEVPMETPFDDIKSEAGRFKKAAYYTDHCLGEYFKAAKKEKWYDNTLFILVADHGHRLPRYRNLNTPESKRITLLFYGNVLTESAKGSTITKLGNQNDIAATLLNQLDKNYDDFPRSKDLLNTTTKDFAYYTNNNVLGWVTPYEKFTYTFATKAYKKTGDIILPGTINDSLIIDSRAYLQTLYQQYLDY